jgi:iron complex outermembrane receptor protein
MAIHFRNRKGAPSRVAVAVFFLSLVVSWPLLAASPLEITVTDSEGNAIPGAVVSLVGTGLEAVTDGEGVARFEEVAAGTYEAVVRLPGFLSNRSDIQVTEGAPVRVSVSLSEALHFSESVTVTPTGRDTFESYQPATVLGGEDLQQRLGSTLGATLSSEPGVNVRSFGSGNQRPVIRGLDNDRVLILENGSRTGDLSSQSADHGVNLDPATAGSIEVVRGPATLLYGSSAIGGVVNLVSDEIPTKPVNDVHGSVTAQGATADENGGISGDVSLGNGRFAVRFNGSAQRTSDYETPDPDLETVPNTFSRSKSGGGAFSFTGPEGYAGASYQYVTSRYGVPFVEEGETTLNPRRHRLDFRGERRAIDSFIDGIKFQGAYRDYAHDEIEGSGEIATSFENETWEGELFLHHRPAGRLQGTWGLWLLDRDYSSAGEEALAPPTSQRSLAGFLYEELEFRHVSLQFGGRLDHTTFDPDGAAVDRPDLPARDFTEFSGSVGVLGYLREAHDLTLAVNFARAARNPSLEELYNLGPHAGNFAFEIGDPDLPTEVGYGFDVSLRYRGSRLVAEGTGFLNRIDQFIFPFQTGEVEDDLPVIHFISADSELRGLEAHVDVGLTPNLWLILGGDTVRGEVRDGGGPLPRIPPYRLWGGLRYETNGFHLEGEVKNVGEQTRVYGAETPTDGYTTVNLHGSYQLITGSTVHTFTVRLDNATDELYRNHLSYIKDLTPEMGRSLKVVYGLRF